MLAIIDATAELDGRASLAALTASTGIPKPTVLRVANDLAARVSSNGAPWRIPPRRETDRSRHHRGHSSRHAGCGDAAPAGAVRPDG
ncbi:iclR helix-turn-helix domain protein [Rhodococcus sp. MTM3W5.2]|nr:iclR helix-turn-helix domain protein [Rhodococcus sp. MTM3W5.2]